MADNILAGYIKDWYTRHYPSDELGEEINSDATFEGLFYIIDCRKDVYEFIGVGDSIIRDRLFQELSRLMDVNYDYIYNQWLYV